MAIKWPSITEGVTKATKGFFESIFAGVQEGVTEAEGQVTTEKARAEAAETPLRRWVAAPTGNAVTDTANIQSAINLGPGVVRLREGTYITNLLTLLNGVMIIGMGVGSTTVKLANGANTDLLHSENWESVKGVTTGEGGIKSGGFRELTWDGNKANNTAPSESSGLISIYGRSYTCRNFIVRNAAGNGFYSEWAEGGNEMEAWVSDFKIISSGKSGLKWAGPHDSHVSDGQIIESVKKGVHTFGQAATEKFTNVHVWGAQEISWLLEGYSPRLVGCEGEGALLINLSIQKNGASVVGGQFFSDGVTKVGIKMGTAGGGEIGGCHIDTTLSGHTVTELEIAGSDWHNYYHLDIAPHAETQAAMFTGILAKNSTLIIPHPRSIELGAQWILGKNGLVSFGGAGGQPGNIGSAEDELGFFGVAPVTRRAPIASPAETLASLKTSVDAIRTALTQLGLTK